MGLLPEEVLGGVAGRRVLGGAGGSSSDELQRVLKWRKGGGVSFGGKNKVGRGGEGGQMAEGK